MQKVDSNSSAGTAADSEQKDENLSVSQHSAKPLVVGSQSHGTLIEGVQPITEILSINYSCQSREPKSIINLLSESQALQLQSILMDLYYKGVKLKVHYGIFK